MALATKCPHCNTIFRVAADQLKLRGGIVRCGACHEVFDGNAALVEPAAKPTPVIPDVAVEAKPAAAFAAPVPHAGAPAVPGYVQGAPVDFELDFAEGPDGPGEVAAPPHSAPSTAPAVWRTAGPAPVTEEADNAPVDQDASQADAPPSDGAAPATPLPWDDALAAVTPEASAAGTAPELAADEAEPTTTEPLPDAGLPDDDLSAAADGAPEPGAPDADAPSPADGRIEPSLDTPQEHIVAAALDDAHHFEDLPPEGQAAAADAFSPAGEPWSLAEPERDDTALHAVAAVNTDVPDDGASLTDDEPQAEDATVSRRERALKRAKDRRDASGPAPRVPEPDPDADASADAGAEADAAAATDEADAVAEAGSVAERAARMRALAGVDESADEDLDHSDLSFVKRVERSQKYGKAITLTMAIGIPLLLAGLVLQAATTFRDTLAANYPQLKPALAAVCQPLGCKIALPAQLDALSVEQGELVTMAENTFSYSTVLRNQSKTAQAWPHLELTLNDNADKPVLRRVFAPREYLPAPADAERGFGPRSEQSIKLYFELKELKASGYHIAIFYP